MYVRYNMNNVNFMDIATIESVLRCNVNNRIDIYAYKKIALELHNICLKKAI